jgi:menaquinol-cytochrome c reductase cytochrome b subunit
LTAFYSYRYDGTGSLPEGRHAPVKRQFVGTRAPGAQGEAISNPGGSGGTDDTGQHVSAQFTASTAAPGVGVRVRRLFLSRGGYDRRLRDRRLAGTGPGSLAARRRSEADSQHVDTFLLIIAQFVTGMFLAMYYVPDLVNSYRSTYYILHDVTFGSQVLSMHNWGSSLIIIMVTLHMVRIYWMGAYRKPRELNWIVGSLLLLIILAFGFTGYLLPWDEKAYFATQVGVSFVKYVPFIGNALFEIVAGGTNIGAATLSRFFAVHVLFLPALLLSLLGLHFLMIRRNGITGPY